MLRSMAGGSSMRKFRNPRDGSTGAVATLALAVAIVPLAGEATFAACTPIAANDITATCTGATYKQGGGAPGDTFYLNGYGTGTETNITVNLVAGNTIVASDNNGIYIGDGAVSNGAGAIIDAVLSGIAADTGAVTVINSGSIVGKNRQGVFASTGATVSNNAGASISGDAGILAIKGTAIVTNSGTITGTGKVLYSGNGIQAGFPLPVLTNGNAIVTNSAGASITGANGGIFAHFGTATVTNSGTITGGSFGIGAGNAKVTNNAGGSIAGGSDGISTLSSMIVTNDAGASITGGTNGIGVFSANVINSGTITGTGGYGIRGTIANVTNNAGASITGSNAGIVAGSFAGVASSVFNAGTISGGSNAIVFSGAGNTLTLGPGSVINGLVVGAGSDTFQLGGTGASTFDVSQLGSKYQGFGTFNKIDSSIWTLTGTSTFAGPINVNGGTLSVNGDIISTSGLTVNTGGKLQLGDGSIVGDVTDNGILAFNRTDSHIFGGIISGTGVVQQNGTGTLTLTGTNSYSGGTAINIGTLAVSSDANLGAASGGLTFNGGTLKFLAGPVFTTSRTIALEADGVTFDTSVNPAILNGNITGVGSLTEIGVALGLGGTNTYSGPTNVNSGSLRALSTGAFSSASAFRIAAGATVDLNGFNETIGSLGGAGKVTNLGNSPATLTVGGNSVNTTFSGTITDGPVGTLALWVGTAGTSGVFTLAGANTYTGATTVNAGTLSVNGSIASSSLTTVNAGGTLGGTGTVGDTLINGGTLAPGNSIGALMVAGNLVLTAASTYMVEVSPTSSDFTHVTGTADLGGATVSAHFAPGSYIEKRYTILTADGGVSGTFSGPVNTDLPPNFKSALAYDGNNAFLDLTLLYHLLTRSLGGNQQQVADTLTNFFDRTGGILLAFGALDARGLSQASGEIGTTASQAAFDAQSQFLNAMTDPFAGDYRGNVSVPGSSSQALGYAASTGDSKPRDAFAALVTKAPPMAASPEQRWRTFGAVYGGSSQIGGNAALGSHDATARVYGGLGGAAYALSPATQLGFALGGGGTAFGLSDGLGSGRSDLFQAGVFARHGFATGGYLAGAFAYGWHDVTTERSAPTGERLRGAYKTHVLSGRVEAGWRIDTQFADVTPYAAAQTINYRIPSYLEQGNGAADSFALSYAGRDVTATRSELGLRLVRTTVLGKALFTLRGRAAWAHNFDTARNAAATFQALAGSGFLVNGAAMAGDAALVTAGAEIAWRNGFALAASFEGEFSSNVTSYTGKGTLRYAW